MKHHFITAFLTICILTTASAAWAEAPARVVSLKPTITDTIYALGLGARLVGVTRYCDVPAGFEKPAVVADYTRPYLERIVALSPDLVLGSMENSSRRSIENLRRMGLEVKIFPFGDIGESLESIKEIASTLGETQRGLKLADDIETGLDRLRKKYDGGTKTRAVVVWGRRPLVVAGPGTFMDEALGYVGATNAVRGTGVRYPRIGLEELIALDPDVIVDLSMGSEADDAGTRPWERTAAIDARIISLDMDDFRAGPRLVEGLTKLGKEIHRRR